jgi:hypothetical protein
MENSGSATPASVPEEKSEDASTLPRSTDATLSNGSPNTLHLDKMQIQKTNKPSLPDGKIELQPSDCMPILGFSYTPIQNGPSSPSSS